MQLEERSSRRKLGRVDQSKRLSRRLWVMLNSTRPGEKLRIGSDTSNNSLLSEWDGDGDGDGDGNG